MFSYCTTYCIVKVCDVHITANNKALTSDNVTTLNNDAVRMHNGYVETYSMQTTYTTW